MNANEYQRLEQEDNVFDFSTLSATRKLLEENGKLEVAQRIDQILANGGIDKQSQHDAYARLADFYRITLPAEDIEVTIDMLLDLEASAVTSDGQTTTLASFYGSLLDAWNDLLQRSGRDT